MGTPALKIGVLTSSRADFGIYLPLLQAIQRDSFFDLKLIVFGTHLSELHGYTRTEIEAQGFRVDYAVNTLLPGDSPGAIALSMANAMTQFAQFWEVHQHTFDLVFCLGDRYEMFAAVSASAPFRIKLAHIHGGEKTMGAIDNFFRHSISHQAWCHFTATEAYAQRLHTLLDEPQRIYAVGSLSIDSVQQMPLLSRAALQEKYSVSFGCPLVLVTFHPETAHFNKNLSHAHHICDVLTQRTDLEFLLTMPNADTSSNSVRKILSDRLKGLSHVKIFENLGSLAYFSLMQEGDLLLGNSSSGIIEAASFGKFVINLGERQRGRMQSDNVINVAIDPAAIQTAMDTALKRGRYTGTNIYYRGGSVANIISTIKQLPVCHEN